MLILYKDCGFEIRAQEVTAQIFIIQSTVLPIIGLHMKTKHQQLNGTFRNITTIRLCQS